MLPSSSVFTVNTHLEPTALRPSGSGMSVWVLRSRIDCSSDLQASDHWGHSGNDRALLTVSGMTTFERLGGSVAVCIAVSVLSRSC